MIDLKIQKIFDLEKKEQIRQKKYLSLIASESLAYEEVLKISSSVLTNKYAEGYPNERYYSGCKYVDEIELIAIEEAKKAFNVKFTNVQPLSGSIANIAIYKALLKPNEQILSMDISSGGHISHSTNFSFAGYVYKIATYKLNNNFEIDYESIKELAIRYKPKLIIAGSTSFPMTINFQKFREIADLVGAYLLADISHLSGLIIAKIHDDCFPHCHVAMTTTHKQIMGPRGAIILWNEEKFSNPINKAVFPGIQGGPQAHLIAAKAIALSKANTKQFIDFYLKVKNNAKIMYHEFKRQGISVFDTDTHMIVLDVKKSYGLDGNEAQNLLEEINISTNKNIILGDTSSGFPSGIRLGTIIATQRNLNSKDFIFLSKIIHFCLKSSKNREIINNLKASVEKLLSDKE